MPAGAEPTLSRRGLLGAGLGRALYALADEPTLRSARRPAASPSCAGFGEADATRLGPSLEPVARHVLAAAGLDAGRPADVLVVAAGDGTPLSALAARGGHRVTAVEADGELLRLGRAAVPARWLTGRPTHLPVADTSADAALAWFGASFEADRRALAAELQRCVRPGGALALAAWTPAAVAALAPEARSPATRPEQWSRFETAYRHFFGLTDLDVEEGVVDVPLDGTPEGRALGYAVVRALA